MYITKNINFSFLANQNTDSDMSPQVIGIEKEKDRNGNVREVLVLRFPCRVDTELLKKSNCEKIEVRLSKFDLSYYRTKSKLTQTKVVVSKMQEVQKQNNLTDSAEVENKLQSRFQKRKSTESVFRRNKNNSGDNLSRRLGGNKNRDKSLKFKNTDMPVRPSPVKKALNSKIVLEPKNLVATSKSAASFSLIKNQDIYSEAKKIASINFGNTLTIGNTLPVVNGKKLSVSNNKQNKKERMLKPDIILKIEKSNLSNNSKNKPLYVINKNILRNYTKHYNDLIDKSIDPMKYFQDSIDKSSFDQQRKGIKDLNNSTSKLSKQSKSLLSEIRRQISQISSSRYEFKKVVDTSRYKIIECIGRVSLEDFQTLGRKAYVLYIAKDSSGINLQAQEYAIQVSEVLKQRIKQSTKASCSATRNTSGVSKLSVSNALNKYALNVDIKVKNIKRQTNFIESHFDEMIINQKIQPRSILSVVDGATSSKSKRPINFNANDNLFFRATLNYRDKRYDNAFSASIKGVKGSGRNDNIPSLNIIATIDEKGRGIKVQLSEISSNVAAVKLVKYRYTGRSKGKLLETFDEERNINTFSFLSKDDENSLMGSISFFDSDVFQDRVYMYTVECIMNNGERKLATSYFIEKFEERTETVLINNISIDSPNFLTDTSSSVNEEREVTRAVEINFNISKIETEIDKVITNLFGNLFEIYKDELTKIKDVQGLVYSIEVQRIDKETGDSVTVNKVTADQSGNCKFVDNDAPAFSTVIYKLIPRVRPAREVITSIVAQTPFLAKKTITKPVNFVSAAARVNAKNRKDSIYTAKKDKFNDRNIFKKGTIRSPKHILEQNSDDLFADASTGDVAYVEIGGLSENRFFDSIRITGGSVKEIKHLSDTRRSSTNLESIKTFQEKYYEINFETNNDFLVDFYVLFVKEGKHIYIDGTIHSPDIFAEEKNYKYLAKHIGGRGVIEYYAVPILKNGRVLKAKLLAAQLVR